MEIIHLNQRQLANRWGVSEATLERWRAEGIGPQYLKLGGRVMYLASFVLPTQKMTPCTQYSIGTRIEEALR